MNHFNNLSGEKYPSAILRKRKKKKKIWWEIQMMCGGKNDCYDACREMFHATEVIEKIAWFSCDKRKNFYLWRLKKIVRTKDRVNKTWFFFLRSQWQIQLKTDQWLFWLRDGLEPQIFRLPASCSTEWAIKLL